MSNAYKDHRRDMIYDYVYKLTKRRAMLQDKLIKRVSVKFKITQVLAYEILKPLFDSQSELSADGQITIKG